MHGRQGKLCAKLSSTFLRKWCKYKVDMELKLKKISVSESDCGTNKNNNKQMECDGNKMSDEHNNKHNKKI